MMNRIYDFSQIGDIRARQKKLIFSYALYSLCFIVSLIIFNIFIKNNLLLTLIFAVVLLTFILFSVCFFKIKYGILEKYRSFLDDLETGKAEEYIGVFEKKTGANEDEEWFDICDFSSTEGNKSFLVHKQTKIEFEEGRKYHLTYVGKYMLEWKKTD